MSANTTIEEGGKGYPFGPVKCLMVEGDNGEFYPWYPEADRALDSLSVTQNGIYRAGDRGVYGWNRVSANVQADSVTGRDPETGEEKTVTVDPRTGELVETVVPVEIRVITPPTKTVYEDGEIIDYSGIVVHAYSAAGQDMGAVPFDELVFPTTKAEKYGIGTYVKFDRETYPYVPWVPDIFRISKGLLGRWTARYVTVSNLQYEYELEYANHGNVDDLVVASFLQRVNSGWNAVEVHLMVDSDTIATAINYISHGHEGLTEAVAKNEAKERTLVRYASGEHDGEQGFQLYNVGKTVKGNIIKRGFGSIDYEYDYPSNPIPPNMTLDNDKYSARAIMYSILWGKRMVDIQWARPTDKKILSAQLPITIDNI